jgi:hypothetical protein
LPLNVNPKSCHPAILFRLLMFFLLVKTPSRAVVVVAGQRLYNAARCMRVLLVKTPTRAVVLILNVNAKSCHLAILSWPFP